MSAGPSTERCKHEMIRSQCAICRGMVHAENQTRFYGTVEETPDPALEYPPRVWNQVMDESVLDSQPLSETEETILPVEDTGDNDETEEAGVDPDEREEAQVKEESEMEKVTHKKNPCKVPGCKKPAVARGFCLGDYDKWRKGRLQGDWPPYERIQIQKSSPADAEKPAAAEPPQRKAAPSRKSSTAPKPRKEYIITSDMPVGDVLTLDLRDYPEILEALRQASRVHIRSMEHQAISCVRIWLVQENYITEPRQ